jgi:hypothetical protein
VVKTKIQMPISHALGPVGEFTVIARCAKRAVAIQLDCFVVPQSWTPHNDRILQQLLTPTNFRCGGGELTPLTAQTAG